MKEGRKEGKEGREWRRETSHKAAAAAFFLINEFALQFRKAKEREEEGRLAIG